MTRVRPWRLFGLLGLFVLLHVLNHVDRNLIASFGPEIVAELQLTRTNTASSPASPLRCLMQ